MRSTALSAITALVCLLAGCSDEPAPSKPSPKAERPAVSKQTVHPEQPAASKQPEQPEPGRSMPPAPQAADIGDNRVSFPELGLSLVQPKELTPSKRFSGFENLEAKCSVMGMRFPGPLSELEKALEADAFAARRMQVVSTQRLDFAGEPGCLVHATLKTARVVYSKWYVAFGNDKDSILITASLPRDAKPEWTEIVKAVLLSARRDRLAPAGAGLPFTIEPSSKLKATPSVGKMLMFTRDGSMQAKAPTDPMFVVGYSHATVTADDRRRFAEQRIRTSGRTTIQEVVSHEPIQIDGLDGFETMVESSENRSRVALREYQVMLFDEHGYILMQGQCGESSADELVPAFRAMARSLKRK